ncbi:MAG: SCO family protein [Silvanigrellaceae bacterium]|nr:SCO family protein [Silvanigrellaceae bacterium]
MKSLFNLKQSKVFFLVTLIFITQGLLSSCSFVSNPRVKEVILPANTSSYTDHHEPTIADNIGQKVNTSLIFTDEKNNKSSLKELLKSSSALLITLNYYSCTTMCTLQFANLAKLLKELNSSYLDTIQIATISFDPNDTVKEAFEKYKIWALPLASKNINWHFFIGDNENIVPLTKQLNFYYEFHPEDKEYAHSSALFFVKPDGTFYRYLYGMIYTLRDLKFALIETSEGKLGSIFEKFSLQFRRYNAITGKYTDS